MLTSGTAPPIGREAVVRGVDRAGRGAGRGGREQRRTPARRSAPPCPPCCRRRAGVDARVAGVLVVRWRARPADPEREHGREHHPALPLVADQAPVRVGEGERDQEQCEDLDQIGEPVGFSNGCAEFALYDPPPLVPSSLIASWLATGPPVICCVAPSTVVRLARSREASAPRPGSRARARRGWTAAAARADAARTRSTQKLPIVAERRRDKPRISATATATRRRPRRSSAPSARPSG